uniref:Uncharacterized protein n=1 Tax=Anguilla anguilla TaxID=7936 RepID=A0A0E9XAT0_ANGAN
MMLLSVPVYLPGPKQKSLCTTQITLRAVGTCQVIHQYINFSFVFLFKDSTSHSPKKENGL